MSPRSKPVRGALLALVVAVVCSARPSAVQETTDYVVSRYELTVALDAASAAARVTMDLTYRIASGTKSEGFKYVAGLTPADLAGTEADGTPMRMSIERQRETMIKWRFTPSGRGEKRVRVTFTIPAALSGTSAESVFHAPWAGIFKVPVERGIYRLIPPDGWRESEIATSPAEFMRTTFEGRRTVQIEQRPLRDTTFDVRLRPGLIATPAVEAARSVVSHEPSSRSGGSGFWIFIFVLILVVFVSSAKRGKGRGGSSASSSSSCAGGSSCSSSCGGGGCGGGCGG